MSNKINQEIRLITFDKERVRNAVEIDIFAIFGCVFIDTNLAPPNNYSGAVVSLSFYRPHFNAYSHAETENSSIIVQIERSRISCEVLATLPVEKTSPSTKTKTQSWCRLN